MEIRERAACFAALGDPLRLSLVDDLVVSDRSPAELGERHGLASNLLAHHLGVLEQAGLVKRSRSSGDGRRRYVHLRRGVVAGLGLVGEVPGGPVLFVCTHNSARSQLAAAVWSRRMGSVAWSAGTHPADRIHPGAVAAAERAGLDLSDAVPRRMADIDIEPSLVVTVCDRAREELVAGPSWWHWSIPDPVEGPAPASFDTALAQITERIEELGKRV